MSRYYEKLKNYYSRGLWNEERMRNAVDKEWLTVEEFEEITNTHFLLFDENGAVETANETPEEEEETSLNDIANEIKRRYDAGEDFEEIIKDYPKLPNKEIQDIKDALGISDTPEEEAEDEKA